MPVMMVLLFCSCNQREVEELSQVSLKGSIAENSLVESVTLDLLNKFSKSLRNSSLTKSENSIIVDESIKTTYHFKWNHETNTKSNGPQIPDSVSVDLYLMKFHEADGTLGYSIATGDERINKVYVYSHGDISDTARIYPLAHIIKSIPFIVKNDIENYYKNPSETIHTYGARPDITTHGPLLCTHWHQEYPYNSQIKAFPVMNAHPTLKGHAPVGCAATATAQVVTFYSKFKADIMANGKPYVYNFSKFAFVAVPGEDAQFEVSQLCKEIGIALGIDYYPTVGILYDPRKIGTYLADKQGYSVETKYHKNIDINKLADLIMKNNPHITAGVMHGTTSGHVWVWDGVQMNWNTNEVMMVHCNWGMGIQKDSDFGSDTWFTPATMSQIDSQQPALTDDQVQIYLSNNNSYYPGGGGIL